MYCPLTGVPCSGSKTILASDGSNQYFLCTQCANCIVQKQNYIPNVQPMPSSPLEELISGYSEGQQSTVGPTAFFLKILSELEERRNQQEAMSEPCPVCGHTLLSFMQTGRLGCPSCYEFFHSHLEKIIYKVHDGKLNHVGKKPKHNLYSELSCYNLEHLQKQMAIAVKEERYEEAAKIRDQINSIKNKLNN